MTALSYCFGFFTLRVVHQNMTDSGECIVKFTRIYSAPSFDLQRRRNPWPLVRSCNCMYDQHTKGTDVNYMRTRHQEDPVHGRLGLKLHCAPEDCVPLLECML